MVHGAQRFTQLGVSNRGACILDVLVITIESIEVHVDFVGIRTETAGEVHLLVLLVDTVANWNSDVLAWFVIAL